jgi:hypothetical protein
MLKPGSLIATITLGTLAALPLSAQSATDLADVCKAVGDAKLGQWASFDATGSGSGGGGSLRLALVGSERGGGDSTLYWFEVNFTGKDPAHSGTVQILSSSLASGSASPRALIIKAGPQPAMKVSGEMAGMMGQKAGQNTTALDWAARCNGARVVGWESVTVPAGTFRALHVTTADGGEVWASRDVPFGLVKTHSKQGDLALTGRGADAKSSITEKPIEMPGMMTLPKP